ncbi:metalloregulator ArsR/SmtB family transcription factor [Luteimonas sp. MJ250]|uniref:ArsR/SmtB family transcription factor n=1 Tax=Luteimonas sp. MJ250 TaxID=3129236 RepID=UPI0031B9EDAC
MPSNAPRPSSPEPLASGMAVHAGEAAALLKALAHPARLLVLCQLVEGERTVGELQPATGLGASALSQHLAVLRDMALVHTRRQAQCIHYSLADGPAVSVLEALHAAFCAAPRPHNMSSLP